LSVPDPAPPANTAVPEDPDERLRALGVAGAEGTLFTGALSPEEAGLLRREGYRARGLVAGIGASRLGRCHASRQRDCEVTGISDAYHGAMAQAVSGMRREAQVIGAHGIVGVRLSLLRIDRFERIIRVRAIGTAVEGPGSTPTMPWASHLSGQEWWTLRQSCFEPTGLVWGHCAWFVLTMGVDEITDSTWVNKELTRRSEALGAARHGALGYLLDQARPDGATGVAGVRVERRLDEVRLTGPGEYPAYEREHYTLLVSVFGTGIRRRSDVTTPRTPQTPFVLSLRDDPRSMAASPEPPEPSYQPPDSAGPMTLWNADPPPATATSRSAVNTNSSVSGSGRSVTSSIAQPLSSANQRLAEMRERVASIPIFTSDLSANELLLVQESGFDPVGLVVGCSIYHIGDQQTNLTKNHEMTTVTTAMSRARELAMSRMEAEAHALGADGIVGVRLEVEHGEWGKRSMEFSAIGTAIVHRNAPRRFQNKRDRPFTSDLSGQDFCTLLRAGYRPLGLVMGNCVYHIAAPSVGRFVRRLARNAELPEYTQALYNSRELAMSRMQQEARALGARGVVGANVHERTHTWGARTIEFLAMGTAVEAIRPSPAIDPPALVLPVVG
jgi:uncharacterized protein YbjQ (UPF0145 family)